MKRLFAMILCAVLCAALLPAGAAAAGDALDPEREAQICAEYLQELQNERPDDTAVQSLAVEDISVQEYYGTWQSREVVLLTVRDWQYTDDIAYVEIGGYLFQFGSGGFPAQFLLCHDGSFTQVAQAYARGLISDGEIGELAGAFGAEKIPVCDGGENCPSARFTDVAACGDWSHTGIDYAVANGLMQGVSDTGFAPETATSRGMIVTILYRLEGEPSVGASGFADVPAGEWYSDAVAWAADKDIVLGYGGGLFGPNETVTREQLAAILYRYAGYKGYGVGSPADLSGYTDAGDVSEWAAEPVQWALGNGLLIGDSAATLNPLGGATRAESAALLMRFCETVVG